jgi:hypothetical protein
MKKVTSLIVFLLMLVVGLNSQNLVNDYQLNEDFQDEVAPWGFTAGANTTITIVDAGSPRSNLFQLAVASASGRRISNKVFSPAFSTDPGSHDGKLYVEFEWQSGTPTGGNRGFIRLLDGTSIIAAIGTEGSTNTNVLHYGNLDAANQNALVATTLITPEEGNFPRNEWYHVKIKLDFATKKVDQLIVTRLSNSFSWTISDKDFINNAAASITKIEIEGGRQGATNGAWTTQIDNLKVYSIKQSAGSADVTINYLDQNSEVAKVARVAAGQAIGVPYAATADDKMSFTANGSYYAYDAANTTADQVVVAEGGSVINLKFKKSTVTAGTYSWTGTASANWNEIDANFTTDNVNALGYQNGNAIAFGAAGTQKAVVLTGALNTADQDVVVSEDAYTFSGAGSLAGTGAFVLNLSAGQTASVNVINNLTGGVVINGGTAVIQKDAAATKLTIANGATVNISTGAAFSKAIQGAGTVSLIPTSNFTYSSAITGVDQLNYSLVAAGAVTTAGAFSAMPILNNVVPAGAKIQVNNTLGVPAMFGSTISFANVKVELGANVDMVYAQNPNADGSTVVAIGELSGATGSKVKGTRIGRTVTYNIGASNTNSTFAGQFENFDLDQWGNIGTLNVTKVGTGKLTLSGASTAYVLGTVAVSAGELEVNGTLGTATTPVTVAADGTLSGTGTVGGAATVNGTLKGSLSFAGALTLAGTTELTVGGFGSGQFDKIFVAGNLTRGGQLNVNITALPPAVGTKIKLIDAVSSTGSFAGISVPAGYNFDESTGELTRDFGSSLNETAGFRIYPTRVTNDVIVEGQGITQIAVYNVAGQLVKTIASVSERNTINMNQFSNGAYLLKVGFADGSVKVQNILLQK